MRFINTRVHGIMDYLMGIVLIIAPWLFGFANGGAAQWVPIVLGLGALVYSMITDYELGLLKILSMKVHLGIDLVAGIFLAASPWIFGFAQEVYLPHLILGILEVGASLMTQKQPAYPETSVR